LRTGDSPSELSTSIVVSALEKVYGQKTERKKRAKGNTARERNAILAEEKKSQKRGGDLPAENPTSRRISIRARACSVPPPLPSNFNVDECPSLPSFSLSFLPPPASLEFSLPNDAPPSPPPPPPLPHPFSRNLPSSRQTLRPLHNPPQPGERPLRRRPYRNHNHRSSCQFPYECLEHTYVAGVRCESA